MQITAALDAELRAMGELVGIPRLDSALRDLLTVCLSAVPSCLGLRVSSTALGGYTIETSDWHSARENCRATMRLDLLGLEHIDGFPVDGLSGEPASDSSPPVSVLLLAEISGAFADLVGGADPLSWPGIRIVRRTVNGELDRVVTPPVSQPVRHTVVAAARQPAPDGRLPDADESDDMFGGLQPMRVIHQAIGVLIDRGLPPTEALQLLHHQAQSAGRSLPEQAAAVMASTVPGPERSDRDPPE